LCDKVSPGTLVSSTNKTDRHDIAEILLKVKLNTITPNYSFYAELSTTLQFSTNIKKIYSKTGF
jgi:hypothetical protein